MVKERNKIFVLISLTGLIITALLLFSSSRKRPQKNDIETNLIETGRHLFFDNRLSYNNTKSCASCHDPKFAFTDGYRRSITANGDNVKHNAPSLINISLHNYFDWANPAITSLEKQHERPLFNESPIELGAKGNETQILSRLKADDQCMQRFSLAFPGEKYPLNFPNIIRALASFVGTIRSFNAPYDKFMRGDTAAMTLSAKQGMKLFYSKDLQCGNCHRPPLFTMASLTKDRDSIYFNTGVYNVWNKNKYPSDDNGLAAITKNPADDGKFKIPSLRNVALTAPYMHDGSINTLEEVIDMYQRGGRLITSGPNAGDGRNNLLKNKMITGFALSNEQRNELISFLYSFTDSSALSNPLFQYPNR